MIDINNEWFEVGYSNPLTAEFQTTGVKHWTLSCAKTALVRLGIPYEVRFCGVTLIHASSDEKGYALTGFREKA
jgi:hypothetical protein